MAEAVASTVKDRTLLATAYLNAVPLGGVAGRPVRGYTAASRAYFGVREVAELTLAQSAMLAVITSRPGSYLAALRRENLQEGAPADPPSRWRSLLPSWLTHRMVSRTKDTPATLLARLRRQRDDLIDRLGRRYPQRYGVAALSAAKSEPLAIGKSYPTGTATAEGGQFLDYVLSRELPSKTGRIYTTLDLDLQHEAVIALQYHTMAMKQLLKLDANAPYESAFVALSAGGAYSRWSAALFQRGGRSIGRPTHDGAEEVFSSLSFMVRDSKR